MFIQPLLLDSNKVFSCYSSKKPRFMFITHPMEEINIEEQVRQVIAGGCRLVQLRMKDKPKEEVLATAKRILPICHDNKARLIINDYVDICLEVGADGVHLGKEDMMPKYARKLLGKRAIIGATCNRIVDMNIVKDYVDYFGVGPLHPTETKKKLAPFVSDVDKELMIKYSYNKCDSKAIVLVGGISLEEARQMARLGSSTCAVSGSILRSGNIEEAVKYILEE